MPFGNQIATGSFDKTEKFGIQTQEKDYIHKKDIICKYYDYLLIQIHY